MNNNTMKNHGVGIDIETVNRFEKVSKDFLEKIYTEREIKYCFSRINPAPHLAARFCGKEAATKALIDCGLKSVDYKNIEITNNKNGHPQIKIDAKVIEHFTAKISISHTSEVAIAIVVIAAK